MRPGQGIEAGKLAEQDALRDRLRRENPGRHIYRTPWGWAATNPDVQAKTLDELAGKLGGDG